MRLWHVHSGASHAVVRAPKARVAIELCAIEERKQFQDTETDDLEDWTESWMAEPLVASGDPAIVATWWGRP